MKYTILINNDDNDVIPQIELLESLGHTVEIMEVDPKSTLIVDIRQPTNIVSGLANSFVNWRNFNANTFFIQ